MTVEPGREAWLCPKCGFVIGFLDADDNLVVWHYPKGFITLRSGVFVCSCGHVIRWHQAAVPHALDKDAAPMVQ